MSAVEALAEVLRFGHWPYTIQTDDPERRGEIVCGCGWERLSDGLDDWADHLSAALVAAIRSMPAEQVAELIGGAVERGAPYGIWAGCIRVQTAWKNETPPLGVSPETNGEQK